jgi:hypothetical protein
MPVEATLAQARALVNGLWLLLLSLGTSDQTTSAGTIAAQAASMASGTPYASDPLAPERANEVLLAKSILESLLLSDEAAAQWRDKMKILPALEMAAAESAVGAKPGEADDGAVTPDDVINDVYDCIRHQLPLGGTPIAGGLGDQLKRAWGDIKDAASAAVSSSISAAKDALLNGRQDTSAVEDIDSKATGYYNSALLSASSRVGSEHPSWTKDQIMAEARTQAEKETAMRYPLSKYAQQSASAAELRSAQSTSADNDGVDIVNLGDDADLLNATTSEAQAALEDAMRRLQASEGAVIDYQSRLKDAAMRSGKLAWASAMLKAPEDVAKMLTLVAPNTASAQTFLQSLLSLLPAAKQTGSLSTLKALISSIRAAMSSGGGDASLLNLLTGDPGSELSDDTNRAAMVDPLLIGIGAQRRAASAAIRGDATVASGAGASAEASPQNLDTEAAIQQAGLVGIASPEPSGSDVPSGDDQTISVTSELEEAPDEEKPAPDPNDPNLNESGTDH